MNIIVKTASTEQFNLLAEIGRETFHQTWKDVNTPEDMEEYMSKAFEPSLIKSDIENSSANTFLLAYDHESPAGYAKLRRDRTHAHFTGDSALEVERIYVLKKWQNKKAGKALMDHSIGIAKKENRKWIWLGVNDENIRAIDFYKRYGFEVFGEKMFQLGNARDRDYLMKLQLNKK